MAKKIEACRICGNPNLEKILTLGDLVLTGVFPKTKTCEVTSGPLELVKCTGNDKTCGLLQLNHSYDLHELYGMNYGYRSGLNKSMRNHLNSKVNAMIQLLNPLENDVILDIGSNDGTTLSFYPEGKYQLVGFDPTGVKFKRYYRKDIKLATDFFSAQKFRSLMGTKVKAKLITSIAMFYDLENPLQFTREIESILADNGLWHFEQSYMPSMLETNAYDTICHEHLEYYALKQVKWLTDRSQLKIIDVDINKINGGSFAITVSKKKADFSESKKKVLSILGRERVLDNNRSFEKFKEQISRLKNDLNTLLQDLKRKGRSVLGYGASTKGNVILQFCGIKSDLLPYIAEINESKFGCFTPGTHIPIISEKEAHAMKPDYLLVLPWHFKDNLMEREREYLARGGKMIFPLPRVHIEG